MLDNFLAKNATAHK